MRAIVQRVSKAKVEVAGEIKGEIERGIMVLIAISDNDNESKVEWMCNKLVNLRIFEDENSKMNRSVCDIEGSILIIPNFTLYGDVKKGFRPSFYESAQPDKAELIYDSIINYFKRNYSIKIETGIFGADMHVSLTNSGPVTIIIDK